jgi:CubicO group peptidase (beta-lactamase class C family)
MVLYTRLGGTAYRRNPHALVGAVCIALSLLAVIPVAAQTKAERIAKLVEGYHRVGKLNGSVLVAEKGKVIYREGLGEADRSWGIPNTPETRFRIGSVTKQFTASLVLQLVDEGALKLDATISDYLPEYPRETGARITIHHLLTHTSGIPNYTDLPDFVTKHSRVQYEPSDFAATFSGLPLDFEPGSKWRYSNSGYFVLGVIIEKVAGRPYDVVLRERLLDPLGLKQSGYDHYDEVVEKQATGYVPMPDGTVQRAPFLDPSIPFSAGMMYSTVDDLFKWDQALYGETFVRSASLRKRMFTPHMRGYGFGWRIEERTIGDRAVKIVEHGGAIPGFHAGFRRMPEERNTIIVLDNTSGQYVEELVDGITNLLYDQPATEPNESIARVVATVIEEKGVDAAMARFHSIRTSSPAAYDFDEGEMNTLGYTYLQRGRRDAAIAVFTMNVEAHPDAFNVHDSMGEAWLLSGDTTKAIASYRKAFTLNPSLPSARAALERLGVEIPTERVELPETTLQSYVGRYELAPGMVLTVTRDAKKLIGQITGQPTVVLTPSTETRFVVSEGEATVTFDRNGAGAVASATLQQGGRSLTAKKIE